MHPRVRAPTPSLCAAKCFLGPFRPVGLPGRQLEPKAWLASAHGHLSPFPLQLRVRVAHVRVQRQAPRIAKAPAERLVAPRSPYGVPVGEGAAPSHPHSNLGAQRAERSLRLDEFLRTKARARARQGSACTAGCP